MDIGFDHGDPDRLARDLNAALDQAVAHMSDEQKRQVCAPLDLPTVRVLNGKTHDVTAAAAKRALLVVACASMFHARLDEYLAGETAPGTDARTSGAYRGEWPPKKLVGCVSGEDVVGDLRGQETAGDDAVKLLENVITGLDINTTACHMAATTLGLLSPSTQFRRMRIQRMPFGAQNHATANKRMLDPRLGSLELLDKKAASEDADGQCRLATDWSSGEHIDTGELLGTNPNSQDLVIMNPPYTRDSLRHDQLPPRIETAMKAREKKLMAGRAGHGSSYGTMFIDLGEHLVSLRDGATLALVYPQAGAAAPSALPIRRLLADWFHIEWVICSHDPERTWFSENTAISEILVVARRHHDEPESRPATKFVRLRRNPHSATGAISLADALAADAEHPDADVSTWPAQHMAQGRWAPLGIASAHLTTVASAISDGQLFPVVALGDIAKVGPAGQRIRDAFTKRPAADATGRRALWHNDTARTQTLRARPDTYIQAKPDKRSRELADRYWEQRSNLLLCAKPRLNKCRVAAVWLGEPETCPARAGIDQAVADILGWTGEDVARARSELAREPSVIGRA